jgi:hypothetical protein
MRRSAFSSIWPAGRPKIMDPDENGYQFIHRPFIAGVHFQEFPKLRFFIIVVSMLNQKTRQLSAFLNGFCGPPGIHQ